MKNIATLISGLAVLMASSLTYASVILSPTAISNNPLGENSSDFLAEYTIDQSGLSSGFNSGVDDFDSYIATNPTHTSVGFNVDWFSARDIQSGAIDFDLGALYSVDKLALWASTDYANYVSDFEVFTSLTSDFSTSTFAGFFTQIVRGSPSFVADVHDLTNSMARYVRLDLISNNGGTCCTGFAEIAFAVSEPAPIPEPATML